MPLGSLSIYDVHVHHKAPLKSMAALWLPEAGWPWAALWLPEAVWPWAALWLHEAAAGGGELHCVCGCSAAFTPLN